MLETRRINQFSRTLLASLLIWWDFASSQLPMACLPPGRYFATAPGGPAPIAAAMPAAIGPAPGFFAASPPAIPPGCAPVIRPAMAAFAPAAPVAAIPAMPVLRTPPGFMPAAAFPAFTPAAAFPGLTPAAAFPALLPAAAIPFHAPAAAPGFLPTYSPSVAIPAAPAAAVLRAPPPVAAFPCYSVFKGKKMAKKAVTDLDKLNAKPLAAKLVFRRGVLLADLMRTTNSNIVEKEQNELALVRN